MVYPEYKKSGYVQSYGDIDKVLNDKKYSGYKKDDGKGNKKYNPDFDDYHKLGGATAQQIEKVYFKSWTSYFEARKDYFENPDKDYTGEPKPPGYKKKDGEFILIFTNQQVKFRETKKGNVWMYFPNNKGRGLKDKDGKPLKILLWNINDFDNNGNYLDSYLVNRLMNGKFDIVRIVPKGTGYWIETVYDQEVLKDAVRIHKLDPNIIITLIQA